MNKQIEIPPRHRANVQAFWFLFGIAFGLLFAYDMLGTTYLWRKRIDLVEHGAEVAWQYLGVGVSVGAIAGYSCGAFLRRASWTENAVAFFLILTLAVLIAL